MKITFFDIYRKAGYKISKNTNSGMGTGNNYGAILGGFAVWFIWIESAPFALFIINLLTFQLDEGNEIKSHLINSIPYFRYLMMGLGLLLVMRYRPKGLLPEKIISK